MKPCGVSRLGLVAYQPAWELQKRLAAERAAGHIDDSLLLLEHPHTYTLGRAASADNLVWDEAQRAARGVQVMWVDRGGDVTYHGPGQLVGYPILDLGRPQKQARWLRAAYVDYVRRLEAMLVEVAAAFGVEAHTEPGYTGVWVERHAGPAKIAAIGVRVSGKGVSTHGFALNANTDLGYFDGIVPCGIPDRPVTSLAALLGHAVDMQAVMDATERAFASTFGCALTPVKVEDLLHVTPA